MVQVIVRVFDPETGRPAGSWRQKVNLALKASETNTLEYELFSRIPVDSKRYELRLGVEDGQGQTASVHAFAEVPRFSVEALSLSGLVLGVTRSPVT